MVAPNPAIGDGHSWRRRKHQSRLRGVRTRGRIVRVRTMPWLTLLTVLWLGIFNFAVAPVNATRILEESVPPISGCSLLENETGCIFSILVDPNDSSVGFVESFVRQAVQQNAPGVSVRTISLSRCSPWEILEKAEGSDLVLPSPCEAATDANLAVLASLQIPVASYSWSTLSLDIPNLFSSIPDTRSFTLALQDFVGTAGWGSVGIIASATKTCNIALDLTIALRELSVTVQLISYVEDLESVEKTSAWFVPCAVESEETITSILDVLYERDNAQQVFWLQPGLDALEMRAGMAIPEAYFDSYLTNQNSYMLLLPALEDQDFLSMEETALEQGANSVLDAFLWASSARRAADATKILLQIQATNYSSTVVIPWRNNSEYQCRLDYGHLSTHQLRIGRWVVSSSSEYNSSYSLEVVGSWDESHGWELDMSPVSSKTERDWENLFYTTIFAIICCLILTILSSIYNHYRMRMHYVMQPSKSWRIKYEELHLTKTLGKGATGTVYKAKWHGKDVAVKVFNEEESKSVLVTAFVMEVAVLQELRHPNVVLFMGACFEKPKLCIVTELLRGSLYDCIRSIRGKAEAQASGVGMKKRTSVSIPAGTSGSAFENYLAAELPWIDRLNIVLEGCLGMSYLHEMGMLHHDLKSPNLLLGAHYMCKVGDFGMISLKPGSKGKKRHLLRKSTEYWDDAMSPKPRRNSGSEKGNRSPQARLSNVATTPVRMFTRTRKLGGSFVKRRPNSDEILPRPDGSDANSRRSSGTQQLSLDNIPPAPSGAPQDSSGSGSTKLFRPGQGLSVSTRTNSSSRKHASSTNMSGVQHQSGGHGSSSSTAVSMFRKSTVKKFDPFKSAAAQGAGTPQWTAPEVIEGNAFTEKADVFSFGVIMSEIANLDEPYKGMQPFEVTIKVVDEGLRPTFVDSCPSKIKDIALRCMRTDPKERPTLSEVAMELSEIQQDWIESGAPDQLSSKAKSSNLRRRNTKQSGKNRRSQEFTDRPWFINHLSSITFPERNDIVSEGDYWRIRKGKWLGEAYKFQRKANFGQSGARLSLTGMLSNFGHFHVGTGKRTQSVVAEDTMDFSQFALKAQKNPSERYMQTNPSSSNAPPPQNNILHTGSLIFPMLGARTGGASQRTNNFANFGGLPQGPPGDSKPEATDVYILMFEIGARTDLKETFATEMDMNIQLIHNNVLVMYGGWSQPGKVGVVYEAPTIGLLKDFIAVSCGDDLKSPDTGVEATITEIQGFSTSLSSAGLFDDRIVIFQALSDVASGLNFLHNSTSKNVHKNVRASNIYLFKQKIHAGTMRVTNRACTAKIGGFGFDFIHKIFSKKEQKLGSPGWSAPEVLMSEEYIPESDIYSFGATMWEILVNDDPFRGEDFTTIARRVCMERYRLEAPGLEHTPFADKDEYSAYVGLMNDCMQGDPGARPSIKHVRKVLGKLLASSSQQKSLLRSLSQVEPDSIPGGAAVYDSKYEPKSAPEKSRVNSREKEETRVVPIQDEPVQAEIDYLG